MRIATFNVLHGRSTDDGRVEPDRLRAAVRMLDVDLLALQEVDHAQPRSGSLDLTGIAAEAMGAGAHRFAAALAGTPGGVWRAATDADAPDAAAYGVALLSRFPVREWRVLRLPGAPVRAPLRVHHPRPRWIWVRDEPRVAILAVVATPLGELTVVNTHLSFLPVWNRVQLRRLLAALGSAPEPHLLMGDLNLAAPLPRELAAWRALASGPTFPVDAPRTQLDHLLWRGEPPPRVLSADVVRLPLSDHRALVAELAAPPLPTGG
jgi:endonuclease/exonuclease/phosphatase family metal-dependent hydrolase